MRTASTARRHAAAWLCATAVLAGGCGSSDHVPFAPSTTGPGAPGGIGSVQLPGDDDPAGAAGSGGGVTRPPAGMPALWEDPAGDVLELPGMLRYPLDVLSVSVDGEDGVVRVRFALDRTMAEHFAFPGVGGERTGGVPCELYLDLDDDAATGAEPFWREESEHAAELFGYEAEVDVLLGFDTRAHADGTEASFGGDAIVDDDRYEVMGTYVAYWLLGLAGPLPATYVLVDTRPHASWEARAIELRIPYEWLGVEPGDTLRAMYRENDQGIASGIGYSANKRVVLR